MLYEFLREHRETLIERARVKVAARLTPQATEEELQHGVPLFLDQLVEILRISTTSNATMLLGATRHGELLLRQGFTIAQVVHDYGDVCQAVTELAAETGAPITVDEFRTFNLCLDNAIASAVTEYARLRQLSFEARETERLGILAHEVRNCLSSAILSFQMLKGGTVAIGGSTGSVLERSLRRMRELIGRTLTTVRIDAGLIKRVRVSVSRFVEDIEVAGVLEATIRGLKLTVTPVDPDVDIEVDETLLAAAVTNVLQNALKFTCPGGQVWLRTHVDAERVRFEIEDECGGLPRGAADAMFQPFEQQGADRSGLGLGLMISRQGVEANGGSIHVRDVPGRGCVFTIELPHCGTGGSAARTTHPRRVLIVDDEVGPAEALRDILELEGHEVRAVHDGPAALRIALEFQPAIVFLDLGLPRMDGYMVARELRTLLGRQVLLVAATAAREDKLRLKHAGFDAHLRKPLDMHEVLALLKPDE
jgi:signal transduction histidine kinase/CheY-like chemotaxis protein